MLIKSVLHTSGSELLMVERFDRLSETMRRRAKAAVAFFVPLLELNIDDVHTFFSCSSSRTWWSKMIDDVESDLTNLLFQVLILIPQEGVL